MASGEVNKLRSQLVKLITDELKTRIKSLGLIDTGDMLDSTKAVVRIGSAGLDIEIESEDYYVYVDGEYNITDYVMELDSVTNLIGELVTTIAVDDVFGA